MKLKTLTNRTIILLFIITLSCCTTRVVSLKKKNFYKEYDIIVEDTLSASYCRNIYDHQKVPNKLKIIEKTCLELYPPIYNLVIKETKKLNNGWRIFYAKDLHSEKKYKIISYNEKKQGNFVGDTIRNVILEIYPKKFKIETTEINTAHNLQINCFKGYMNEEICRELNKGYFYIYSTPDL